MDHFEKPSHKRINKPLLYREKYKNFRPLNNECSKLTKTWLGGKRETIANKYKYLFWGDFFLTFLPKFMYQMLSSVLEICFFWITSSLPFHLDLLYFELRPGQKCHSKMMHRKEVTYSNGSYERKSCGLKLADEMGRGKKIPMVHS